MPRYTTNVQCMNNCWLQSRTYEEYVHEAARLNLIVHTEQEYKAYCAKKEAEVIAWIENDCL